MAKLCKDKCGTWYGGDNYLSMTQQQVNARAITKYCQRLSSHQWSKKSIQAICGNMSAESNINPQVSERGGGGYGLVQWTPKSNLIDRAKKIKQYKSYDMMYTQMQVIDYEASNNLQWIKTSAYPLTFAEFMRNEGNHSLEYLVGAWLKNYERPLDQSQSVINHRTQLAEETTEKVNWDSTSSDDGGSVDDFLEWCKKIADDNEYRYIWGANHSAPPWTINPKGFDCSSFICYGLKLGGGYDLPSVFPTSTMKNGLTNLGFESYPFNRSKLKRGDIVLIEGEHVEAIYSVGNDIKIVGAHASEIHGVPVPVADQISVKSLGDDTYQWILRPFDSPSSKPRENPTNSNKSSRKKNPKTPSANTQNALPPTFLKRKRRF